MDPGSKEQTNLATAHMEELWQDVSDAQEEEFAAKGKGKQGKGKAKKGKDVNRQMENKTNT